MIIEVKHNLFILFIYFYQFKHRKDHIKNSFDLSLRTGKLRSKRPNLCHHQGNVQGFDHIRVFAYINLNWIGWIQTSIISFISIIKLSKTLGMSFWVFQLAKWQVTPAKLMAGLDKGCNHSMALLGRYATESPSQCEATPKQKSQRRLQTETVRTWGVLSMATYHALTCCAGQW